jgi:hypothetical protein
MAAFPGAIVFSTAGAVAQIEGQLFKYLKALCKPFEHLGWNVNDTNLTVTAPEVRGLQSKWVARVPRDALTMEGYHGAWMQDARRQMTWCPVCVILDESKSLDNKIYEAAWRIEPDWLISLSTPGDDSGPFYEAINPDSLEGGEVYDVHALWKYRRKITRRDCPHLMTTAGIEYLKVLTKKYGRNSSYIKSFSEGEFQRDTDENNVFTDDEIDLLRAAMRRNGRHIPGRKYAGLEFSSGTDEQVINIIDGNKQVLGKSYHKTDTNKLAALFVMDLNRFGVNPRDTYADNGGVGKAIIDNMEGSGFRGIVRYMNNQESINKHEYADRITEDHYRFKEILRTCPALHLINDPILLKQSKQRRFRMNDHNQVKLEEKPKHRKRTGESPDRLDTMIMMMSNWAMPSNRKPEPAPYHSIIEEKARQISGRGQNAAFGWVTKQQDLFKRPAMSLRQF